MLWGVDVALGSCSGEGMLLWGFALGMKFSLGSLLWKVLEKKLKSSTLFLCEVFEMLFFWFY
ncbi:MAG TPA: hypothetical protein P5543_07765 [Planctomycetota bacterium]|nr:hypothetical protein [Planctomycetota bacterium]